MKKMEKRSMICLALVIAVVLGLTFFTVRFVSNGADWAAFYANDQIYKNGRLIVGEVVDRNGVLLMKNTENGTEYNNNETIRRATMHVVGDKNKNVATGANTAFRDILSGYNLVTGTGSSKSKKGGTVRLAIDAELNVSAYKALNGRNGFVSVYNWKTGDILCMVSTPSADPESGSATKSGTYLNKVLSSTFAPGSTFKLVTSLCAMETISDIDEWTFDCKGSYEIDGEKVTCSHKHGKLDFYGALANSCNCAFAELTLKLGAETLQKYVDQLNLNESYEINGVPTAAGTFNFDTQDINLAWSGIGQYQDEVNPLAMMVYMGAIAGGGSAKVPSLLAGKSSESVTLLSAESAEKLSDMMRNNVKENYGDKNYPDLRLHAKSGTAEKGTAFTDAWFVGFSGDYAFVVCVENGGGGASVAGPVANKVLQEVVK